MSSMKPVPGAKKVVDHCAKVHPALPLYRVLAGAIEPAVIGVGLQEAALLLMTHPTVFMWDGHPSVSQPNP